MSTKYTVSNGGRLTFGGWKKKGRQRFAEINGFIKAARKTPESKAAEAWALEQLRIKYKTAEKRSKKAKKVAAVEEEDEWDDLGVQQDLDEVQDDFSSDEEEED